MSTHSTQMVVSKNHSHVQGIKAPWRNGHFQGCGRESHKMSLEHLTVLVSKEELKYFGDITRSHKGQAEEGPPGQIWNNLSTKTVIVTGYLQNKTNLR